MSKSPDGNQSYKFFLRFEDTHEFFHQTETPERHKVPRSGQPAEDHKP